MASTDLGLVRPTVPRFTVEWSPLAQATAMLVEKDGGASQQTNPRTVPAGHASLYVFQVAEEQA